ncbi:MAG: hypothetical protein IT371_23235 [Deltaproteobacteria bacterium]|nr:hypothetical protein [Deltaproteobacteria bacterium]
MHSLARAGLAIALGFGLSATPWLEREARACSQPDTNTSADGVAPGKPGQQPPLEPAPGGTTGDESAVPADEPVVFSFKTGYDTDADPNKSAYYGHPHRAYTLVTVTDQTTGKVVVSQRVAVWDYDALAAGTKQRGDAFERVGQLTVAKLPAGKYEFRTQAVFAMHDKETVGPASTRLFSATSVEPAGSTATGSSGLVQAPTPSGSTPETLPSRGDHQLAGGCSVGSDARGSSGLVALLALLALVVMRRRRAPR